MGRVKSLWEDEIEAKVAAYMEAHPDADPADAYEAVYGPDAPSVMSEEVAAGAAA